MRDEILKGLFRGFAFLFAAMLGPPPSYKNAILFIIILFCATIGWWKEPRP